MPFSQQKIFRLKHYLALLAQDHADAQAAFSVQTFIEVQVKERNHDSAIRCDIMST
jgi:hypothetical protein